MFQEALKILTQVFGSSNLHVATAQEDLAYALYVLEYSSGRFYMAKDHAERAIRIIQVRYSTPILEILQKQSIWGLFWVNNIKKTLTNKLSVSYKSLETDWSQYGSWSIESLFSYEFTIAVLHLTMKVAAMG